MSSFICTLAVLRVLRGVNAGRHALRLAHAGGRHARSASAARPAPLAPNNTDSGGGKNAAHMQKVRLR